MSKPYRNIAIVVATYNRPKSLKRLLDSLDRADYLDLNTVDLFISCDYSGNDDCEFVANDFSWNFGEKQIVKHKTNLGLRRHILFCGDLVKNYDGIIMLEDDLWVSPHFYKYVAESDLVFKDDKRIGQISLYNYQYDDYSASKFIPIKDTNDNYFMQVPSSWGQYWTKEQWVNFKTSYDNNELEITDSDLLPVQVKKEWPETSWKKYFYKYILNNNLFVVYPYLSLSTNFGEGGTHYSSKVQYTQSVLGFDKHKFNFTLLNASKVIYDYNFELHSLVHKYYLNRIEFDGKNLEFDLNGTKEISQITSKYLISSKICKVPILCFSNDFLPQELNIAHDLEGDFFAFGKTSDFDDKLPSDKILSRNISFIPLILIYKIQGKIISKYEESTSFKLGNKIINIFNRFSIKRK